jgi:hypothetical protein
MRSRETAPAPRVDLRPPEAFAPNKIRQVTKDLIAARDALNRSMRGLADLAFECGEHEKLIQKFHDKIIDLIGPEALPEELAHQVETDIADVTAQQFRQQAD